MHAGGDLPTAQTTGKIVHNELAMINFWMHEPVPQRILLPDYVAWRISASQHGPDSWTSPYTRFETFSATRTYQSNRLHEVFYKFFSLTSLRHPDHTQSPLVVAVSVLNVALALTCVESALFGTFLVLTVSSLCVLVVRHGKENSARSTSSALVFMRVARSPLFIATVVLLLTITAHWILTVRRLFFAFILGDGWRDPETFPLHIETLSHVAATAFVVASVIVGDIILTYRIWVGWNRRYVMVVFPLLCTLAYTASVWIHNVLNGHDPPGFPPFCTG
ncbi:hypothetical protein C8Q80DRAFT_200854 [Daedaleopsis nitida]|nr:hypothetical protein C8Q80DRAFT_200854 [Daedaleopsis nitida]